MTIGPAVVVGGGVIGLSVARALVERGASPVTVLERDLIASGATGRSSGVVRCHYGVRSLAAMAWSSLSVLADAERLLGATSGYRQTGYLVGVGEADVSALVANVALQQDVGVEVELVDHARAAKLWPEARIDDFAAFAFEPRGGYGDGYQTAHAFARAARRGGARIREQTPVVGVEMAEDRVIGVRCASGEFVAAEHVILAAGPWTVSLADWCPTGVPVRAQRAQVLIVEPPLPGPARPVLSDLVSLQYVRPEPGGLLVGDSDHSEPEWADPDACANSPDPLRLEASIAKFLHRFPGVPEPRLRLCYAGCYDVTPDYNPVISGTPIEGLWICAGFSGHGYKLSAAVGTLVADLLLYGHSTRPDIDHRDFELSRFAEDRPLRSLHPYATAGQMR